LARPSQNFCTSSILSKSTRNESLHLLKCYFCCVGFIWFFWMNELKTH
jgi:hypothetical protein